MSSKNKGSDTTIRLSGDQKMFIVSVQNNYEFKNTKDTFDYILDVFKSAEYESRLESKALKLLEKISLDTDDIKDYVGL